MLFLLIPFPSPCRCVHPCDLPGEILFICLFVAEVLWSYSELSKPPDWKPAQARLAAHRERMVARGVGAAPMGPRWCTQHPDGCV